MWPLYYNILKYWTLDVGFARKCARFEYYYGFFKNNCTAVEHNFFSSYSNKTYYYQDEWVIATIPKRLLFAINRRSSNLISINNNRFNWNSFAFFNTDFILSSPLISAGSSFIEDQAFAENIEPELDVIDPFLNSSIINSLIFCQNLELYKILSIIWMTQILKII